MADIRSRFFDGQSGGNPSLRKKHILDQCTNKIAACLNAKDYSNVMCGGGGQKKRQLNIKNRLPLSLRVKNDSSLSYLHLSHVRSLNQLDGHLAVHLHKLPEECYSQKFPKMHKVLTLALGVSNLAPQSMASLYLCHDTCLDSI